MSLQSSSTERFFSVFPGDVRNNITAFNRLLWEHESDIYIFMARKAACFFDCMRELKLADVRGLALNDRVLDMDLSFVGGKRVTLVDDCVFTGTTLWHARNAVVKAGCSKFDTMALAINTDSLRPNLLPGGDEESDLQIVKPVFASKDSDCVKQCYDIVRAISLIPRPYDVDFPHSQTFKVKANTLAKLLSIPGWQPYDVSSDIQRANDVRVFTLLPAHHKLTQFCSDHAGETAALPAAKLRLYIRQLSESSYSLRLVPIIMLPAISDQAVTKALTSASAMPDKALQQSGFVTAQSRYRLLHFILSHSLLDRFISDASIIFPPDSQPNLRQDLMEMSFGEGSWDRYVRYWPDRQQVKIPKSFDGEMLSHTSAFSARPVTVENSVDFVSEALSPFTWLYKHRELATREHVLKHGFHARETSDFGHFNRLTEGFTPQFLLSRIQSSSIDIGRAALVLLDKFIDMGIAVPIIVHRDGICCRAFRHGEDAILGEAQERMLVQALQAYMDSREVTSVWGLELQKFIVLMTQIGLRNGILESLNLMTVIPPDGRILSIKGHLHGPVPTIEKVADPSGNIDAPFLEGNERPSLFLVNDWIRKGYLSKSRTPEGAQYKVQSIPKLSSGTRPEAQARQFGRCLGSALKHNLLNTDHDLVLLSTCAEPDHQMRALSGEVAIFRQRWPQVNSRLQDSARAHRYSDAHKELRSLGSVFVSVNSGAMKYQWYSNGAFGRLVKRVHSGFLRLNNVVMADEWELLWPQAAPLSKIGDTYVWKFITESGRWLITLNVALRLLDYWFVFMGRKVGQFNSQELDNATKDVKAWINKLQKVSPRGLRTKFGRLLPDVLKRIHLHSEADARNWCHEAGSLLSEFAAKHSKLLLDEATAISNAYGTVHAMQNFPYAVFFDVDPFAPKSERILDSAIEQALQGQNIESYYDLPPNRNPWRIGRWILLPGNRNSTTAVVLCKSIVERLLRDNIRFRGVVVGQLSSDNCISKFKFSTSSKEGFFYHRLAQLRQFLLSPVHDNKIGFASEYSRGIRGEGAKFASLIEQNLNESEREVTSNDPDTRKFLVANHQMMYGSVGAPVSETAKTQQLCLAVPELRVLLTTATDEEDNAMVKAINNRGYKNATVTRKKGTYRHLGTIGDADVYWVRSGVGSTGPDAAYGTTLDAIDDLKPQYIISCGLAFGADSQKQNLGQVLVSEWVRSYEKGKRKPQQFVARGSRVPADPFLLQAARSARLEAEALTVTVGGLLSGEKVVDDPEFKEEIFKIEPEAIGGEMEASGIISAAIRRSVRWIVIKAICDWGENKGDEAQPTAAFNSIEFVFTMINGGLIPTINVA